MSAATQGTKTMLEAIDLERERDEALDCIRRALAALHGEGLSMDGDAHRVLAARRILGGSDRPGDHRAPSQNREANSKRDPTIAKDLDREDVEPGLAPPSVAGEDR